MIGGVRILTRQTTRRLCRTFFSSHNFYSRNWCVRIWLDRWLSEIYFNRRSDDCTFFFSGRNFFRWFEKHSRPDDCTFFFSGCNFSGCNWCSYFDTSTNYGTYIWPEKITSRKKGIVIQPAMFFGGFKLQPEKITTRTKKGTVVWQTVEINLR